MKCVCLEVKLNKIAINIILGLKIESFDELGIRVYNWMRIDIGINYELNIVSRLFCSSAK